MTTNDRVTREIHPLNTFCAYLEGSGRAMANIYGDSIPSTKVEEWCHEAAAELEKIMEKAKLIKEPGK